MEENKQTVNEECFNDFLKKMPKVELHAHLNGSLSKNTIERLLALKNDEPARNENLKVCCHSANSISECFQVFHLIHQLTDCVEAVNLATCSVIEEFYKDGVRHLELRSTPREVKGKMTRLEYVKSMLTAVEACKQRIPEISVKLLLAIDRRNPVSLAKETVKIAEEGLNSNSPVIVGIDLSGDPSEGNITDFIPVLQYAKKAGLKLAIHMAEIANKDDEVHQLLQLEPHRIGHGTFLHPMKGGSERNFNLLQKLQTPLEICLTSNVISNTVSSYKEHHFPLFREINYPCTLCTDDKGVFNTSLSEEYYLTSKHYSLTPNDLWQLSYDSIGYSFINESEKENLRKLWIGQKDLLFCSLSCTKGIHI